MADELRKEFGVESELIPGKGGIFEVVVDGKVVFAKRKLGRFPEQGEIIGLLKKEVG